MHLHFEKNTDTKCDCSILSLSWMGKVPDDIPEDDGWKLNRTNYYQEGWLATGNIRGIVGVTFTTSHCKKNMDYPIRTNYNLRGHRSDVILVKWNEPYQKLASCDSSGIIFVWIKYEGRWSIELINDRNTPVTHFSWSHDGRMALICYQDGFVLVGSVAGQRYWSSMLNLESTITCGIWTPDDQQVYFGTTQGQVIVMDVHGAMVSQVQLCSDIGITSMAWSCEKFKMEEGEETEPGVSNASKRSFVLAVSFQNGFIYLLKSFDDVSPSHIDTGLNGTLGFVMEWSNSRELLAVAGTCQHTFPLVDSQGLPIYINLLKFYTEAGVLLYTIQIPNTVNSVSALTWGHNDKRLFVATGTQVHIAWVSRRVASLQLLCRLQIQSSIGTELAIPNLPLPSKMKTLVGHLFAQTIRCCVPNARSLRDFVSRPPACSTRLHCTMIRHDDENNTSSGTCYTLYLEYLGGLVPLLKGKRTSKLRPEFVIFDPQSDDSGVFLPYSSEPSSAKSSASSSHSTINMTNGRTDSSDSEADEGCNGSPKMTRKRKHLTKRYAQTNGDGSNKSSGLDLNDVSDELAYMDTLPEEFKLVEVNSNIWGTKFKIHGTAKNVPANLGQISYKTSLLHLQPRQMTVVVTELRDDFHHIEPDPNFNPNIFSEDEDENNLQQNPSAIVQKRLNEVSTSIAPMSPRPNRFIPRNRLNQPNTSNINNNNLNNNNNNNNNSRPTCSGVPSSALPGSSSLVSTNKPNNLLGPLAKAESYEDDFPYIDLNDPQYSNQARPKNIEPSTSRSGPSYTSLVTQYSRSSSNSSGQSRHAISPLCCEGSVPTLQSPKNAVAPSDIIFDRPPAGQTTVMSYSCNTDCSNNIVQVKNALLNDQLTRANSFHLHSMQHNSYQDRSIDNSSSKTMSKEQKTNLKKKDDEELITTAVAVVNQPPDIQQQKQQQQQQQQQQHQQQQQQQQQIIHRTPTLISIAPACLGDAITRSCSTGYLDSMEMIPSVDALSILRRDTPNKRLVLVDRKPKNKNKKFNENMKKQKLLQCGKSKSLDSCDLLEDLIKNKPTFDIDKNMPRLNEISDTEGSSTDAAENLPSSSKINNNIHTNNNNNLIKPLNTAATVAINTDEQQAQILTKITTTNNTKCPTCKQLKTDCLCNSFEKWNDNYNGNEFNDNNYTLPQLVRGKSKTKLLESGCSSDEQKKSDNNDKKSKHKKKNKSEVITSYTDSPLFSRKHRFGDDSSSASRFNSDPYSPLLSKKYENSFSFLKQLSESRRRKKEENCHNSKIEVNQPVDRNTTTTTDQKASVSLQAQAQSTWDSLMSRLRDWDENRSNQIPPASPRNYRQPKSSPASPSASKKGKRPQSTASSTIHNILNSPLLNRRNRKKHLIESSDDESSNPMPSPQQLQQQHQQQPCQSAASNLSGANNDKASPSRKQQYRDLETFQKAQLRQKLKRGKIEPNGTPTVSQPAPLRREFVMHNKAPMWNENSQVYQLDFGGRVTQESAKNFQIEFRGKQVMQFGRIDGNAYTLDFQYPFSALQAFSVALANVTQRLK